MGLSDSLARSARGLAERLGYGPITTAVTAEHTESQTGVRSWASPYGVLETVTLEDLYGLAHGIHVTRQRAMSLSVVSKSRQVLCGNIGRLGLQQSKAGQLAPIQSNLLIQPEKDRPLSETLTWTVDSLFFYPSTWWIVQERDFYGWPTWVKLLDQKDADLDAQGKLTKAWGVPVNPADVIQFNSVASGLLHDAKDIVQRALILTAAASMAEDNPVPALDIHNDGDELNETEIEELLSSWQAARRRRGVGYSGKQITVKPLGSPVENLLIEGRKAIDLELVRACGIPAWAADVPLDGSSLTYQNRSSRNWELIDLAAAPYMTAISSRLSMPDVTPRGWAVSFVVDDLTRDDQATRFANYKTGLEAGFLTMEQIYRWEGWPVEALPEQAALPEGEQVA
jgi:hypothetical protein